MAERARIMTRAGAIALFREATVKEERDTGVNRLMTEAGAIALFRAVTKDEKDTGVVRILNDAIMIEAKKATDPARITVMVTPAARVTTGVASATDTVIPVMVVIAGDTDATGRIMTSVARARNKVKVKTSKYSCRDDSGHDLVYSR